MARHDVRTDVHLIVEHVCTEHAFTYKLTLPGPALYNPEALFSELADVIRNAVTRDPGARKKPKPPEPPLEPPKMNARIAYSIREVAPLLSLSRATIYNLIKRGDLTTIRVAGRVLVPVTEIQRIMEVRR